MRHTDLDITWESAYSASSLRTGFASSEYARPVSKSLASVFLPPVFPTPVTLTPRRAAPPLMPHCPAGRRAPTGSEQQTLFVILDQMGARHRAVSGNSAFKHALEAAGREVP